MTLLSHRAVPVVVEHNGRSGEETEDGIAIQEYLLIGLRLRSHALLGRRNRATTEWQLPYGTRFWWGRGDTPGKGRDRGGREEQTTGYAVASSQKTRVSWSTAGGGGRSHGVSKRRITGVKK